MSLVWSNFRRGGSEKLAMLALADWCNDSGESLHPSIAAVARKINASECQARRIIHKFILEEYLLVVGNEFGGAPGSTRHYKLNLRLLDTPSTHATPSIDATPSTHARRRVSPMRERASAHESLTIIEPSLEPPLPSWLPKRAWDEFKEHRASIKKKLTALAEKKALKVLADLVAQGHDPVSVIDASIANGWAGLFPPKGASHGTSRTFRHGGSLAERAAEAERTIAARTR